MLHTVGSVTRGGPNEQRRTVERCFEEDFRGFLQRLSRLHAQVVSASGGHLVHLLRTAEPLALLRPQGVEHGPRVLLDGLLTVQDERLSLGLWWHLDDLAFRGLSSSIRLMFGVERHGDSGSEAGVPRGCIPRDVAFAFVLYRQ